MQRERWIVFNKTVDEMLMALNKKVSLDIFVVSFQCKKIHKLNSRIKKKINKKQIILIIINIHNLQEIEEQSVQ